MLKLFGNENGVLCENRPDYFDRKDRFPWIETAVKTVQDKIKEQDEMNSLQEIWTRVLEHCKGKMTEVAFDTWIKPLKLADFEDGVFIIEADAEFSRTLVENKFSKTLEEAFESATGFKTDFKITVKKDNHEESQANHEDSLVKTSDELPAAYRKKIVSDYTFDTFVVGSSNKFAYAAAQSVAKNPGKTYNPLFIYGNSGLGKTHLLNAICCEIKEKNPDAEIIYTSGEDFTNELISFLTTDKLTSVFHNKYRNADILLIDDIQFLSGKVRTQEEFFHTFETLNKAGKQIVLTSDRPPKEIMTLEERLKTRFEWGLIADIQPPDLETRMAIIRRKAASLNFDISDDVIQYLAEKIKKNIRQLEGAVKKLKAYNDIEGHAPTLSMAQIAIKDILSDTQPIPVTVEKIINEVARTFNISPEEIKGKRQDANISAARQVAIYVVNEITGMSLKAVGAEFGGKDHSTILYNIRKVKDKMSKNANFKATVTDIITNIKDS